MYEPAKKYTYTWALSCSYMFMYMYMYMLLVKNNLVYIVFLCSQVEWTVYMQNKDHLYFLAHVAVGDLR